MIVEFDLFYAIGKFRWLDYSLLSILQDGSEKVDMYRSFEVFLRNNRYIFHGLFN